MVVMVARGRLCSGSPASVLAVTSCALAVALAGCGSLRESGARAAGRARTFTLMQMNLCLSGYATCYAKVRYPGVLNEAVALIGRAHPDAVTFNESCADDVALIARRTGYRVRFSTVIYLGAPLPCIRPRGRGVFGDAVLTRAAIQSTDTHPFRAQAGVERRVWLCVTTQSGVDVCTAHLNTRMTIERPGNDAQCAELRALLAHRGTAHAVIFGGDVNRRSSCAPPGFWTRADSSARQTPGFQQVYGTTAFRAPTATVVPAVHTDHDVLLVRARLAP